VAKVTDPTRGEMRESKPSKNTIYPGTIQMKTSFFTKPPLNIEVPHFPMTQTEVIVMQAFTTFEQHLERFPP